jgi:hypothetical protein
MPGGRRSLEIYGIVVITILMLISPCSLKDPFAVIVTDIQKIISVPIMYKLTDSAHLELRVNHTINNFEEFSFP